MAYSYTTIGTERVQVDVAAAFHRLDAAFRAATGQSLRIRSGTRSTAEQRNIFIARYRVQATGNGPYGDVRWYEGKRWVRYSSAGTVAVPGTSNHEEGGPIGPRALDIYDTGSNAGVTTAGTSRGNWIRNNARNYGFNPAGYNFGEPWHIEFTGALTNSGGAPAGGSVETNYAQWGGAPYVRSIQEKLNRLGYGLVVDGDPGPATRAAIVNFQGKHGLETDGIAGPATNAKLDAVLSAPSDGKLAVDGQWGAATTIKLQQVLGVTADGELGPQTWSALQGRLGVAVDGEFGPQSIAALQKVIGTGADGVMGPNTVSALQTYLNNGGTFSAPTPPPASTEKLLEDGEWGPATTKALQLNLGVTPVDGEFGPITITALQKAVGQTADGQMGPMTIKALQKNVGATEDGSMGPATVKALQVFLNANRSFLPVVITPEVVVSYPKPEKATYPDAVYWNHSSNSTPRNGTKITHFYIHHAADTNPAFTQVARFMDAGNDRKVSCTWFMDSNGEASEIVPPDDFAPFTTPGNNMYSVSVETRNTSREPNWGITEESHIGIAKLVAFAHLRWGIPLDREHVKGHREAPNVPATACPGPSMNIDKILAYAIQFVKDAGHPVEPPVEPPVDPVDPVDPPVEPEDPDALTWTITLPLKEAEELGKLFDSFRRLLP